MHVGPGAGKFRAVITADRTTTDDGDFHDGRAELPLRRVLKTAAQPVVPARRQSLLHSLMMDGQPAAALPYRY